MNTNVEYFTNEPDDAYPTTLQLVDGRKVRMWITTNNADPSLAVGYYQTTTESPASEALLEDAGVLAAETATPPPPVPPGSVVRRVAYAQGDAPVVNRFAVEGHPADAAFAKAETSARALMKEAIAFPVQALKMGFDVIRAPESDDKVVVKLSLINAGSSGVGIAGPGNWDENGISLTLAANRADVPPARMTSTHQVFVSLGAGDIVNPQSYSGPVLAIPAGSKLTFEFAGSMDLEAGSYNLWASFEFGLLDAGGQEVTRAELVSPTTGFVRY